MNPVGERQCAFDRLSPKKGTRHEWMLKQMLFNLHSNVVNFIVSGGKISAAGKQGEDGCLRICVIDTRISIAAYDLGKAMSIRTSR